MAQKVVWSLQAIHQLEKAYEYILKDSFQNAEKVRRDILQSTHKLPDHPEIYSPDKYKKNNDGSFRAYELHSYRIAYKIITERIIIVRVRHTKREPKLY